MLSLKIEYEVPEDRTLHVQLPREIKPGKHEFVLVVDEGETLEISPSEQLKELIGSISWPEEPLDYQRRLREEWP
ncbi:hypothetical protein [Methylococcus sp. Mc7]|uniref:hypothetical protein n=1 Tax=Methylococcus sp. Mc7 TaxID=2860258 RepID=UPI001C532E38|nr:hypothetical protein [Methylococcus sp. Mc7]QXP82854.1 hypothetical protein KW115_11600 [Methylococcus sp. Mc7]